MNIHVSHYIAYIMEGKISLYKKIVLEIQVIIYYNWSVLMDSMKKL